MLQSISLATMALALAPTQVVVLNPADLGAGARRPRGSTKRLHAHLKRTREEMHAQCERSRRPNDDELVLNYVCHHPQAASLIGDGISAVWGVFLYISDPNTRDDTHRVPGSSSAWIWKPLTAGDGMGAI